MIALDDTFSLLAGGHFIGARGNRRLSHLAGAAMGEADLLILPRVIDGFGGSNPTERASTCVDTDLE
jgi:hypothetical protein